MKWEANATSLPEALRQWSIQSRQRLGGILRAFSIRTQAGSLTLRVLQEPKRHCLFLEETERPGWVDAQTALRLSQREEEAIICIVKGMSDKEAADRLSISPQTVKKHLEKI
ncbi:MAG: LuxR C-terminal-related transcriptional regulator [Nitrospira sp.]|nr:LuxR C-terminal-related transcriptional regulator [Nitrospira sp.]